MNDDVSRRVDEQVARWFEATDRPIPRFEPPVTRRPRLIAPVGLSIMAVVLVVAALGFRGLLMNPGRSAGSAAGPVGACAQGTWPVMPVDCETARRSVSWGTITLSRTRIWLTTVGAVKSGFEPRRQVVSDPPADRAVWLFVYDGYKPGVTYQDQSGKLTTSAAESRWLHVADATDPGTADGAYLYIYVWSELGSGNLDVPATFPLPPAQVDTRTPSSPRPPIEPSASLLTPPPSLNGDALTAWGHAYVYERARANGHWTDAWFELSDHSKLQIGSIERFAEVESPLNSAGGTMFEIGPPVREAALETVPADVRPAFSRVADVSRGYIVVIRHPNSQSPGAGTVRLYVAPLRSGEAWRIWILSQ